MPKYWTLYTKENGKWAPQFGDYKRSDVEQERKDTYSEYKKGSWLIIPSPDVPTHDQAMKVADTLNNFRTSNGDKI